MKLLTFNPTTLQHSTLKVSREKSYFYQAKLMKAWNLSHCSQKQYYIWLKKKKKSITSMTSCYKQLHCYTITISLLHYHNMMTDHFQKALSVSFVCQTHC